MSISSLLKDGLKKAAVTGALAAVSTLGITADADSQTIHRKDVPMENGRITFIYNNDAIQDFEITSDIVVGDESGFTDISYRDMFGNEYHRVLEEVSVPDDIDQDNIGVGYDDKFDRERAERLVEQYAEDLAMLEKAEEVLAGNKWSNEYQVIHDAQDRYVGLVNERLDDYGIAIEEEPDENDAMYRLVSTR